MSLYNIPCDYVTLCTQLFVWTGVDWKGESPLQLVEAYLSQFHSRRSEDQYVLTLVSGGNEGAAFWRWFDVQVQRTVHQSCVRSVLLFVCFDN